MNVVFRKLDLNPIGFILRKHAYMILECSLRHTINDCVYKCSDKNSIIKGWEGWSEKKLH